MLRHVLKRFSPSWYWLYRLEMFYLRRTLAQNTTTSGVAQIQHSPLASKQHPYPNQCQQHQEFNWRSGAIRGTSAGRDLLLGIFRSPNN